MTHFPTRLLALLTVAFVTSFAAAAELLTTAADAGAFTLVGPDKLAQIYVDPQDEKVVQIASGLLADDIERVTGRKPAVKATEAVVGDAKQVVLIGTIGQSRLIDPLVTSGKLDVADVKGQWESYLIQTIDNPFDGVERALVIAGSDRRGTAYGVFDISEQIGVSPWYFFADVMPDPKKALYIKPGRYVTASPDVKYRGLFINDEDWGLEPWNRLTFDPGNEDIGPKAYAKIFELILRLRGNHLWPAMHHVTNEFAAVPGNVELADDWAIVMGSAHSEPMLRNNVWWKRDGKGEWNFLTNRENVLAYWEEWAKKRGGYENVWTVGMRGIHDTEMQGAETVQEQAKVLERVIRDQRQLLKEHANKDVTQVPQVFTPYKEALAQYQAGLDLPDDVTILWAEDNYGYIRQLSTPQEQKRSGGSGVYYHVSYLGWPRPYLWLDTTPPALIWSEMTKACRHGADRVWVLNVGDIKSCERGADFWMKLAWDIDRYGPDAQTAFLREWATRDFGSTFADEIAAVMNDYYQLNFQRKPELMAENIFSVVDGEAERRLAAFEDLQARADSINGRLPEHKKDAFYQLVLYPVRMSAATNEAFITADLSRLYARQGRIEANALAERSKQAVAKIEKETAYFNNELAGGKWKHIMTAKGIGGNWNIQWPAVGEMKPTEKPRLGVVVEGQGVPLLDDAIMHALRGAIIDLPVSTAKAESRFKRQQFNGIEGLIVPNVEPGGTAGNTLTPGEGPKATFTFNVPRDGDYTLFAHVYCPTNKDDSFFLKIDDGEWFGWNELGTGENWDWKKHAAHSLKAGRHTLTIANREDGAMVSRFRFTDGPAPQTLAELFPNAQPDTLPAFNHYTGVHRFVDVYSRSDQPVEWRAEPSHPWIRVNPASGSTVASERAWIEIDWAQLPVGAANGQASGSVKFTAGGDEHVVRLTVETLPAGEQPAPFVASAAVVAMEAEHFTRSSDGGRDDAKWTVVPGLGRIGAAVGVLDTTIPSDAALTGNPSLEYDFTLLSPSDALTVAAYCLPTQRTHEGRSLRYAVGIDDQEPQIVDFHEDGGHGGEQSPRWRDNVSRNAAINLTEIGKLPAGNHTLRIWMIDPGVIFDRFVIAPNGSVSSELGPLETRSVENN